MPFQVSGQFVTAKSSRLVHVAGWDGAVVPTAGAAFVVMMSSAEASVTHTTNRSNPDIAASLPMRAIVRPPPSIYRPKLPNPSVNCFRSLEPTLPEVPPDATSGRAPPKHRIIQYSMQQCK